MSTPIKQTIDKLGSGSKDSSKTPVKALTRPSTPSPSPKAIYLVNPQMEYSLSCAYCQEIMLTVHIVPKNTESNSEELDLLDENSHAQKLYAWTEMFKYTPYTTFWMVDYLLYKSKTTYLQLWTDPKILKKTFSEDSISLSISEDLAILPFKPGRCTSFAIHTSLLLETWPRYKFEIYDLKGHRLARCANSHTLIDSSSNSGPFELYEGKPVKHEDDPKRPEWSFQHEGLQVTSSDRAGARNSKSSKDRLSFDEGMAVCLRELATNPKLEPLCLFRYVDSAYALSLCETVNPFIFARLCWKATFMASITDALPTRRSADCKEPSNVETQYHGMIKWLLKNKELRLIQDLSDSNNADKLITFIWDEQNEVNMNVYSKLYSSVLAQFVYDFGGPMAQVQWKSCAPVFRRLWMNACMLWGFPRIEGTIDRAILDLGPDSSLGKILETSKEAVGNVIISGNPPEEAPNFTWLWRWQFGGRLV